MYVSSLRYFHETPQMVHHLPSERQWMSYSKFTTESRQKRS